MEETTEGNGLLCLFLGFILGMIASLFIAYNTDSDRASLETCSTKLERDRYCVMVAVPSEYSLKLEETYGKTN